MSEARDTGATYQPRTSRDREPSLQKAVSPTLRASARRRRMRFRTELQLLEGAGQGQRIARQVRAGLVGQELARARDPDPAAP